MTVRIAVRISDSVAEALDRAVARGEYATRTQALRVALERLERELRDREIAQEYRRAYGEKPQQEWIGELGLALLASAAASEKPAGSWRRGS
jgi:Arc/MetJ-type ribon-helix-helix transcriptional regulator